MSRADDFKTLFSNIAIDNASSISQRYGEVTRALNLQFRDIESRTANTLQVGSYGRWTGIKGISDLDMIYIMPNGLWDKYKDKPYQLLRDTADAISNRYTTTEVYPDTLVVVIKYQNFKIEAQPVFEDEDGFWYPYTRGNNKYRLTKPREELSATRQIDNNKNGNLRRLAKMTRAWKNKHGVAMGGLLVDTLAHNFLIGRTTYDTASFGSCGQMMRDFLFYLADQPKQDRYGALGSGQHVKVHKAFQNKAKKGLELADKALEAGEATKANNRWRKLLGRAYPISEAVEVKRAYIVEAGYTADNTEEFIEDQFPVDIRHSLRLECEVRQHGFRTIFLRAGRVLGMNRLNVFKSKSLRFYIVDQDIKGIYHVYWKVLNRGSEAIRLNKIRGQIEKDSGSRTKQEHSNFRGEHVVDCFAVQNGVVIAKDRIHVPIVDESER
ncbi:nucleotidyltransferase [Methylobacterium sp. J-090]|nr:nucleotidyltransferase [Methylobacterium sp. J-090]